MFNVGEDVFEMRVVTSLSRTLFFGWIIVGDDWKSEILRSATICNRRLLSVLCQGLFWTRISPAFRVMTRGYILFLFHLSIFFFLIDE